MKTIVGFFEVAPGEKSIMRLIFFIGMIWAMTLISYIFYLKAYKGMIIGIGEIGIFAGIIFGIFTTLKLWQNKQEDTDSNVTSITDVQDPNPPKPKS
jgi:hypothetical protein